MVVTRSDRVNPFPISSGDGAEISRPLVRMLVAHPAIRHISQLQLRYTAYKGWLYNGADTWTIDKVAIVNSFGSRSAGRAASRRRWTPAEDLAVVAM